MLKDTAYVKKTERNRKGKFNNQGIDFKRTSSQNSEFDWILYSRFHNQKVLKIVTVVMIV